MKTIRWRKRLHGAWAGFVGTSRKATCSIRRNKNGTWSARSNWHDWAEAPSWRAASEWCERQLLPPPRPKPVVALVVEADGTVERRAMESLYPTLHARHLAPRARTMVPILAEDLEIEARYNSVPVIETVYEGRWWEMSYEEWRSGINGRFRVFVYAHPLATSEAVERAALGEIKHRRMMLDKALHDLGGRFGGSRELQRVADQIFEGSV